MKKICKIIHHICEELDGAREYAEKYIEFKNSNTEWAKNFQKMSRDELQHAEAIRDMGQEIYENFKEVYLPEEVQDKWDCTMKKYAEETTFIELMLSK